MRRVSLVFDLLVILFGPWRYIFVRGGGGGAAGAWHCVPKTGDWGFEKVVVREKKEKKKKKKKKNDGKSCFKGSGLANSSLSYS